MPILSSLKVNYTTLHYTTRFITTVHGVCVCRITTSTKMARSLNELKRLQRGQLTRLSKEDLIDSILAIPDTNEEPLRTLTTKFEELMKEVVEIKRAMTAPDSLINQKIGSLQDQVKKQGEIISKQQRYLESLDRKERENNIIVTGVPDENEALEGTTKDEDKLNKILRKIEAAEEIKSYRRLGTRTDNRRRAMLLVVNDKDTRDRILNKAKTLKQAGGDYAKIYIKKDVHPNIRMEWRRLREVERNEKERPENSGCVIRLDTRERKVYRDGEVIDEWSQQSFF